MDIILIPGLWLDADSWSPILPALHDAGHRTHPLTMPGVGAPAAESAGVGIADWVDAVVQRIDEIDPPVVLVGHSGGGNVAWGAADRRPDRVARVILVDTILPHPGGAISEFEVVDGVIPFPGWDFFDDFDVADLSEEVRARTAPLTKSVPARVPTDPIILESEKRFTVPVTVLSGASDEAELRGAMAQWGPYGVEAEAVADLRIVKIGSAHWPQFSVPERLAELLVAEIAR